jgi:hypothetical protein
MDLIDFILNLAGLLLWLNWRSVTQKAIGPPTVSLLSTLKRPERREPKRWVFLVALLILLLVRALLYWRIGPGMDWTAQIQLVAISLPCRSIFFGRMLLYSVSSFALAMFALYSWLILLAVLNRKLPESDPIHRLVRLHLGWCEAIPWPLKLLLPFTVAILSWIPASQLFVRLGMMPEPQSWLHVWQQGLLIGLGLFLVWKNLLLAILLLHVLNSYVYLGNHPFWSFVNATVRGLLQPLSWVPSRAGKIDLLPLAAMAAIVFGERWAGAWLAEWYKQLPF